MVSHDKYEDKTNEKARSLARWILALSIVTAGLFLVITFGKMMG